MRQAMTLSQLNSTNTVQTRHEALNPPQEDLLCGANWKSVNKAGQQDRKALEDRNTPYTQKRFFNSIVT